MPGYFHTGNSREHAIHDCVGEATGRFGWICGWMQHGGLNGQSRK